METQILVKRNLKNYLVSIPVLPSNVWVRSTTSDILFYPVGARRLISNGSSPSVTQLFNLIDALQS